MKRTVTVVPEAGLHARPAAEFVDVANEYEGKITVSPAGTGESANARSVLAVSGLRVETGDDVTIRAEGEDAEDALDALERVLTTPEGCADERGYGGGDESEA